MHMSSQLRRKTLIDFVERYTAAPPVAADQQLHLNQIIAHNLNGGERDHLITLILGTCQHGATCNLNITEEKPTFDSIEVSSWLGVRDTGRKFIELCHALKLGKAETNTRTELPQIAFTEPELFKQKGQSSEYAKFHVAR